MKSKIGIKTLAISLLFAFATSTEAQTGIHEVTTVADKGSSGMFMATYVPSSKVCIDKNEAEVFSFYLDKSTGQPYFAKLMPKGGRFCLAPGDYVVIKTTEAKNIVLEETTKSSSVFYNNVISPSEDISVTDFIAEHPMGEGECIYLLTNMKANGGFGFTHFTGVTMRKGCFFIVSTVEPESIVSNTLIASTRAAKDIEDGDPVPFLLGEAGNNDGFVTTAKMPGTSFIGGDANGDGEVDINDVEAISDYIVGKPTTSFVMEAADVNADDVINVADLVETVNIVTGKTE